MRKYDRLRKEALEACKFRGHEMTRFDRTVCYDLSTGETVRETGLSLCHVCGRAVMVDTRPLPNGIDISGEAVALNCEDPE